MPWSPEALAKSEELAQMLGQSSWLPEPPLARVASDAGFIVRSRTRRHIAYGMVTTPEGFAVHQGEGCEHEPYGGPLACWHSKEFSDMTQAITPYQSQVPQRTEFTDEQVQVIKNTICRGSSDAELGLFIATARRTGLDPFMRQIWAIVRNVNVGSKDNPKWEKQMQIQVGIDGYRVIRDRTGAFDGMEGPQWSEDGQQWLDYPYSGTPKFARVAVYRKGIQRPFVAVTRWAAYNQDNAMWKAMGAEQLAKCAESLGYRRAFPAEMSGLPSGPVAELDQPSPAELAEMPPQVAALLEHKDEPSNGEFTEIPAPTPKAPVDLLNAIKDKHGPQRAGEAKAILPVHFGTMDLLKLSNEQRAQFAAFLTVWLNEPEHAHDAAYTPEGRAVCGRCGIALQEPDAAPADAQQAALGAN